MLVNNTQNLMGLGGLGSPVDLIKQVKAKAAAKSAGVPYVPPRPANKTAAKAYDKAITTLKSQGVLPSGGGAFNADSFKAKPAPKPMPVATSPEQAKRFDEIKKAAAEVAKVIEKKLPAPVAPQMVQQDVQPYYGGGGGGGGGSGSGQGLTVDDSQPPAEVPMGLMDKFNALPTFVKVLLFAGAAGGVYFIYRKMKKRGGGSGHRSKS